MTLQVVGAGVCRTGTLSLKGALERLLGAPCHHMMEVFGNPDVQVPQWQRFADGGTPDWDVVFDGFAAAVDFPSSLAWRDLVEEYPDAPVLLSTRTDVDTWWRSASATVFAVRAGDGDGLAEDQHRMLEKLIHARFGADESPEGRKASYLAHNEMVRAAVPADRLVEWQPGDGWEPLCRMLGVPVPDEPFPEVNSTAEFRRRAGLD